MSTKALIEVQDQFGTWHSQGTAPNKEVLIRQALQRALHSQLASKSKRARAVDADTGDLIDMVQG